MSDVNIVPPPNASTNPISPRSANQQTAESLQNEGNDFAQSNENEVQIALKKHVS